MSKEALQSASHHPHDTRLSRHLLGHNRQRCCPLGDVFSQVRKSLSPIPGSGEKHYPLGYAVIRSEVHSGNYS